MGYFVHFLLGVVFVSLFLSQQFDNRHTVRFAVRISGYAFAVFMFLAPSITFKRIVKNRSTEQFSGVPYVMTLLNCLFSAWYGMPFMSPNNLLVSAINRMGAVVESVYVIIFIIYAPKKEKGKILGLLILGLAVIAVVVLVSPFAPLGNDSELFCGIAANVFTIMMYASPLTITRMVFKTKSVEFMPFFLSYAVFLCGNSWFMIGVLGNNTSVAIPNGIGFGLGAVQRMLYCKYENKKDESKKESGEMEKLKVKLLEQKTKESVEMEKQKVKLQEQKTKAREFINNWNKSGSATLSLLYHF